MTSSRAPSPAGPESGYDESPSHSPAPVARGLSPGRARTPPLPPTAGQHDVGTGEGQEGPALSEDDIVARLAHLRCEAEKGGNGGAPQGVRGYLVTNVRLGCRHAAAWMMSVW